MDLWSSAMNWRFYESLTLLFDFHTTSQQQACEKQRKGIQYVPELREWDFFLYAYKQALVLKKRWQMIILFQHHSSMTDDDMAK